MDLHSARDCYCKTGESITPREDEIHSERSRVRHDSRKVFPKTKMTRDGNKDTYSPAKVVIEDWPDLKKSTVTPSVSPMLSPETSAALDDIDRFIKDVEIQMKEIHMVTNCNRFQKLVYVHPYETSLEDENDHLLYVRERVAHKFQEANGWIYPDNVDFKRSVPRTPVDYSAPKFQTFEERCKGYPGYDRGKIRVLGLPTATNVPGDGEASKRSNEVHSPRRELGNGKKTNCSVQTCPSVDIKKALVAQNLETIHIFPDPAFVPDPGNVGTYMYCHDSYKKNGFTTRKEKFVRISESNANSKKSKRPTNSKGGDNILKETKDVEIDTGSSMLRGVSLSKEDSVASDVLSEANEKCAENVENQKEMVAATCMDNQERFELKSVSDNRNEADKNLGINETGVTRVISVTEEKSKDVDEKAENSTRKVISENRSNQKQVRFEDCVFEDGKSQGNAVDLQAKDRIDTVTKQDVKIPLASTELEKSENIMYDSQFIDPSNLKKVQKNYENSSLNKNSTEQKENRGKELNEREICDKEKQFEIIDQCFANILKKHCGDSKKDPNRFNHFFTPNSDSSGCSEDSLFNLRDPLINDLDGVLSVYNKVINDVAESTRTIDKFLSRPEIKRYTVKNKITVEKKELISSTPMCSKVEKKNDKNTRYSLTKRTMEPKSRNSVTKERLPATNKYANKERHVQKAAQPKIMEPKLTKISSIDKDKDFEKKRRFSGNSRNHSARTDLNTKGRRGILKKIPDTIYRKNVESTENSDADGKIVKNLPRESCLYRNVSSSLTSSSNPSTSSLDFKLQNIDETNALEGTLRSSIDNYNIAKENKCFEPSAASKGVEVTYMEKEIVNYKTLCNSVYSDVYKQVLSKLKDTSNITEQLIGCALREEMRFIEDKVNSVFNLNQVVPVLVNNLLDSLKADSLCIKMRNEKKEGDTMSKNDHLDDNLETVRLKSDNEKEKLVNECPRTGEEFGTTEVDEQRGKSLEKNSKAGRKCSVKSSDSSNDQLSVKENHNSRLSETDKGDFGIESLKEVSNLRTDEINSDESIVNVPVQSLNSDAKEADVNNFNSTILQNSNFTNVPLVNIGDNGDKNEESFGQEKILLDENVFLAKNEEIKNTVQQFNKISDKSSSKDSTKESLESRSVRCEEKISATRNNLTNVSSTDSLHNCESLECSPENPPEPLTRGVKSLNVIIDAEEYAETNDIPTKINEMMAEQISYRGSMPEKDKILSELYNSLNKKLSSHTYDADNGNVVDRNYRLSSSVITTESDNVETSDTSRSEGELCIPSSGSCSLGEIRILKKSFSEGENADECENDITIMVPKKMLDSWNESSKSLMKSIGEI